MDSSNDAGAKPGQIGFKRVTSENVLEVDPVVATLVTLNHATGEVRPQEPEDWISIVTLLEMNNRVPREIRRMFLFSQGLMCYAHWYYPALTLVSHDMLRIADTSAVFACKERGINQARCKRFFTFAENVAALVEIGVIRRQDEPLWRMIRNARNRATHPAAQHIYGFSMAYDVLKTVRDLIDRIDWLPT